MGANSFGLAITIGIQLLSLPIFLHYWDTPTYGVWIMLSAIPAYLSMADAGMVAAAGNQMTMSIAQGNVVEANKTFQSAQLFMTIACSVMAVVVFIFVMLVPFPGLVSFDRKIALITLSFGVLLSLFAGLTETVYTATSRYATGAILGNLVRLAEWLGSMLGLVLVGSFTGVALSSLAARLICTVFFIWYSTRGKHGLKLGFSSASELAERVRDDRVIGGQVTRSPRQFERFRGIVEFCGQ